MLRKIALAGICLATAHSTAIEKLQKRDGAHAHDHGSDAGYGAPPASYEPPAPEYGAPATSYDAPVSYGSTGVGYEEEALPDLTPIIVGILVLIGLSLLFPTHVRLTAGQVAGGGGRKRRHAEDGKLLIMPQHVPMLTMASLRKFFENLLKNIISTVISVARYLKLLTVI